MRWHWIGDRVLVMGHIGGEARAHEKGDGGGEDCQGEG